MNATNMMMTWAAAAMLAGAVPAAEAVTQFSGESEACKAYMATDVSLDGASDFTWEAWVKPSDVSLAENRIMGQTDWTGEGRMLVEIRKGIDSGNAPKMALFYRVDGMDKRTVGTTSISAGDWHHVAVTRSGETLSLYVDGALEAAADDYAGPLPDAPFAFAYAFSGALAEVRAWNRALAADELAAVRNRRTGGTEEGLAGCWALNGGTVPYNRATGIAATVNGHSARTLAVDPSLDISDGVPAPIARFSMEDVSTNGNVRTVADLSGNGRDLTLGDGCAPAAVATGGNALRFDGTRAAWAKLSVPALASRTISFRLRLAKEDGAVYYSADGTLKDTYPNIFANLGNFRFYYRTRIGAEYDRTVWCGEVDLNGNDHRAASSVDAFLRENWNHFTLTYEQSEADDVKASAIKLYANGFLLRDFGTLSITNAFSGEQTACIGNSKEGGDRPITGLLDELEIWDCALTEEQVRRHYMRHHAKPPAELLASWDMDEVADSGSGRHVEDSSGNGRDLYLRDGVTATNGVAGGALFWHGTNAACAYASELFPPVSDWSWSGWLKKSSVCPEDTATYKFQCLYSFGKVGYVQFAQNVTDMWFKYHPHNTTKENMPGNAFPSVEAWSHLVLSAHNRAKLDGSGFETWADWYVNGVKCGESPVYDATQLRTPPYRFLLGCNNQNSGTRIFSGAMDSVRVYSGAISSGTARRLYLLPARPDAGVDFTTARDTAILRGRLLDADGTGAALPAGGTASWSLVSAPSGAGDGLISSPGALETEVSLPAAGEYTFRLAAMADGGSVANDVTVTRVAAPAANAAPSVTAAAPAECALPADLAVSAVATDPDGSPGTLRVSWRKVSGPGAAYFDDARLAATRVAFTAPGTYVLEVAADDGMDSASARQTVVVTGAGVDLSDGLVHRWTLDSGASFGMDSIGGRDLALYYGATVEACGYAGYGLRINAENASAQTGALDYPDGMTNSISASCWIYEDTTESYYATARVGRLFSYHTDLEIQHNKGASSSFQVRTKYVGGGTACWMFAAPEVPLANRWAHVAVTAALGATDDPRTAVKLYIDGVEIALSAYQFPEGTTIGAGAVQPAYPGTKQDRARIFWGCANGTYRVFPGVIDEMRIYGRVLSAEEVKALAAGGAFLNRAPQVSVAAGTELRTMTGGTLTIDPGAYDDGLPQGAALAGRWTLVEGDASQVEMPQDGNVFTFLSAGEFGFAYTATDGERTTTSPTVRVTVTPQGLMLKVR